MKISVHPAFLIYLAFVGLIDGFGASISLLFTLMIHEAGHLVIGRFCGEHYVQMELTPLGGMISYKPGSVSCKGIRGMAVALSGPLANAGAITLLCGSPMLQRIVNGELIERLLMMNLSMLLMNMLPALPLDGGRALFSMGYYLFPIAGLINMLTVCGYFCGAACVLGALYGAVCWGQINVTLLACGLYMAFCAGRQRESIYAATLHMAVFERLKNDLQTEQTSVVAVEGRAQLVSIIPVLCRTKRCLFAIERGEEVVLIPEKRVLGALIAHAGATFEEVFAEPVLSNR